jgi:hypothetical protein
MSQVNNTVELAHCIPASFVAEGVAVPREDGECGGHGVPVPHAPPGYPPHHCTYCGLKIRPFVAPPPPVPPPQGFIAGAYEGGVQRDAAGHITGIVWGELSSANAWLHEWKDRAIGPGHPLASGMDPRGFIPSAARDRTSVPGLPPHPIAPHPLVRPSIAASKAPVDSPAPETTASRG